MLELRRELRRLFRPHAAFAPAPDGLAGGDPGLTELLNLDMLRAEAKGADVAAGRVSARDRPMLQLRQAMAWREFARRTGDGAALQKAAQAADLAVKGLDWRARPEAFTLARTEQAACVLLAIELGGDEGLGAAAGQALGEACLAAPRSQESAFAKVMDCRRLGGEALLRGDTESALAQADRAAGAMAVLDRHKGERAVCRRASLGRVGRAELLTACGVQLSDASVLENALSEAVRASLALDPAYEPVSWSRATTLHGEILTAMGVVTGDAAHLQRAVQILATVFEHLPCDHSPLDWAQAQYRLGTALVSLADAADRPDILEKARAAFDRALVVLNRILGHPLRAAAAQARAGALIRQAEHLGDNLALDAAEAGFRCELAAADPGKDDVAWAVCQVNLAQVYLTRLAMNGRDRGERAKAGIALDAALDVFSEHGLRGLSAVAAHSLERLRATA